MKRSGFWLIALGAVLLSSPAFAVTSEIFITDGTQTGGVYNDRTNTVFNYSETPYVYMLLPFSGPNVKTTWWNGVYYAGESYSSNQSALLTLDWNTVPKTPGLWSVQADYSQPGASQCLLLNFSFAPEPLSAGLFLLGGGALALIRRKKMAVTG